MTQDTQVRRIETSGNKEHRMRNFFSAAVVVAASLTVAAPACATDFDAVSTSVITSDLDLGDAGDIARLDRRLVRAADAACADPGKGVDRVDVERGDGEAVERGDEHDSGGIGEPPHGVREVDAVQAGMAMSSRITSGLTASTRRSAASPWAAVPQSSTPAILDSRICSRSIARGSSSTTRARSVSAIGRSAALSSTP